MNSSKIFTVSEINASIRGLLESHFPFISIAGEISNLRQPFSGHMYFTLKDENAQIKAVLFKMQQRYLGDKPADGQHVVCRGRLSVYEPRGDYQLIVDAIDFQGTGMLQLEFEKLKKRLEEEGLFAESEKKPLPFFPEHLTLVTSPQGAAVHDFIRVARERSPQVNIAVFPVAVQGNNAAAEIAAAIETINSSLPTNLIVVCRGGGSLEDLWAFNEEIVARAIADSAIPVVSGIGHEIDFTIADFTADLRAPTPSAAAEMCLPDSAALMHQITQLGRRMERKMVSMLDSHAAVISLQLHRLATFKQPLDNLLLTLDHLSTRIVGAMQTRLAENKNILDQATIRLHNNNPISRLQLLHQKLRNLQGRLIRAARANLDNCHDSLARSAALLDAVSPLSTLARGYSIVRKVSMKESVVTDYRDVEPDSTVEVTLHRGFLQCTIEKTGESRFKGTEISEDSDKNKSVEE